MKTAIEERTFAYSEGSSDKFWAIALEGTGFTVRFGRRGTAGQEKAKECGSEQAARKEYDKLIAEKLGKGYREVGAAPQPRSQPKASAPPAAPTPSTPEIPGLRLAPEDWLFATWRPRAIRPWPAAPAFTVDDGMARFEKFIQKTGWMGWSWERARIPPVPGAEEARFWIQAMLEVARRQEMELAAVVGPLKDAVRKADLSRTVPIDELLARFNKVKDGPEVSAAILQPLFALYPDAEVIALVEGLAIENRLGLGCWGNDRYREDDSFRLNLLPYLEATRFAKLAGAVRGQLHRKRKRDCLVNAVAPFLGLHDEILEALTTGQQQVPMEWVYGLGSPELVIRHFVRRTFSPRDTRAWLAHTGLSALERVADTAIEQGKTWGGPSIRTLASCVSAPSAAPVFLKLVDEGKFAIEARAWFEAQPEAGLAGLDGVKLSAAGQALKKNLERKLGRAAAGAEPAGLPAASALPEGLATAFADARALTKVKTPKWVTVADLPAIVISGARLPDAEAEFVLGVLASAAPRPVHPLLVCLKCYATPDSLDAFAEALFQSWRSNGMSGKEKWALLAVGALGSDRCALRLAPLVREWPGEAKHQAAVWGLDCLRLIGTDSSLLQINQIAQKAKFQALKKAAQETMEAIAADRGLTREELEDRIVPDCGLDARGTRRFDFGPRQFTLRLGPSLKPLIIDGEGNRRDDLPKPTSKDDGPKAAAAVSDWKLLKKQVSEAVKIQIARLEQALVTQRRWTPADFGALLVKHPLMSAVIRPLVWGVFDAEGRAVGSFRVTEDFTLADARDDSFTVPEGCSIGVLHPAHADEATRAAWGEVLADYELIQPFPQLARTVRKLTAKERGGTDIVRHTDASLEPVVFAGILKRLGWFHGQVGDGGSYNEHVKWFPSAGLTAVFQHSYLAIAYYDTDPVSPECIYFLRERYGRPDWNWCQPGAGRVPLREIDEVVVSEVLGDLAVIAARAAEVKKP